MNETGYRARLAAGLGLAASVLLGCGAEAESSDREEPVAEAQQAAEWMGRFTISPTSDRGRCLRLHPWGVGYQALLTFCDGSYVQAIFPAAVDIGASTPTAAFAFGQPISLRLDEACLDVEGASAAPGARVLFWSCHGGDNQRWIPEGDLGADWVRFRAKHSGLCLRTDGSRFTQDTCSSSGTQFVPPRPQVRDVTPTNGLRTRGGEVLTVSGSFLGEISAVTVGGAPCAVMSTGFGELVCVSPAGHGAQAFVVRAGSAQSSAYTVRYRLPTISNVSTSPAPAVADGKPITLAISGADFGPSPSASVGSTACAVIDASDSTLTCTAPPLAAGQYSVVVRNAGGASPAAQITVGVAPPAVSNVLPGSFDTPGGVSIDITGSFLGAPGTVTVGGAICPVIAWSTTSIRCTVPPGEGTQPVVVTTSLGLQSSPYAVSYRAPALFSLMPTTLPFTGGMLTITGVNFGPAPTVSVGSTACAIASASHTQIACAAPALSAGQYPVRVTTKSGTSNAATVTVP